VEELSVGPPNRESRSFWRKVREERLTDEALSCATWGILLGAIKNFSARREGESLSKKRGDARFFSEKDAVCRWPKKEATIRTVWPHFWKKRDWTGSPGA